MFRLLSSVTMEAMYSMTSPRITTYILKVLHICMFMMKKKKRIVLYISLFFFYISSLSQSSITLMHSDPI